MRVYLEGIGLCGPGLDGWENSRDILAGTRSYAAAATSIPPCPLLPANERRRAAQIVKIALAVGVEAFAAARRDAAATATVFTSSGGDGDTIDAILKALASEQRELSPTRFHNSVHNAAAGYWSIAAGSRAASTSLCCHDDSFAAGLLEAAVQVQTRRQAVAVIAYDVQYPAPISAVRPIGAPFAIAFVLAPAPSPSAVACIDVALQPGRAAAPEIAIPALEAIRRNTPAARGLPLLAALARRTDCRLGLDYLENLMLTFDVARLAA